MATWTTKFSAKSEYSLTLEVTEKSYSVANNTSVVEYKLTMACTGFVGFSNYRVQGSLSIGGSSVWSYDASRAFNYPVKNGYSEVLATGTKTITHNTDGTGSCAAAAYVLVASGGDGISPGRAPSSGTLGGTLTLTTIPRASTATVPSTYTIGSAGTAIAVSAASSAFTHRLKFTCGSQTQTVNLAAGVTSYTWTPAASTWGPQFPTQTSRSVTVLLETLSGGTVIGSNSYTTTLKIPDSWAPSVTATLSQYSTNAFMAGKAFYVAGYSAIRAAISGALGDSYTTIASYTISGAWSKTVTTTAASTAQTSGVIASSGTKSITITIRDARGRTGTWTNPAGSVTYLAYAIPAITALAYERGTYSGGAWTAGSSGTDLRITFKATCSLSGQGNDMDWTIGAPVSASGSALSSGTQIVQYATGIGTTTLYAVAVSVTDDIGNTATRSVTVPTVEIPFVIDHEKPAIGIGAIPQTARTLELASDWVLNAGGGIKLKSLSEIPAETGIRMYPFTATANLVPDRGNTIPTYAKGIFECSGNDSILMAVDSSRNLYIGFRNGATWTVDRYPDGDRSIGTTPNYVKFVNGLMIQWGETSQQCTLSQIASSGVYWGAYDVSFPAAFSNNYYVVSGVSQYSSGHIVPIGFARRSTTSFRPYIYDFYPRSGAIRVAWQAIGRWK